MTLRLVQEWDVSFVTCCNKANKQNKQQNACCDFSCVFAHTLTQWSRNCTLVLFLYFMLFYLSLLNLLITIWSYIWSFSDHFTVVLLNILYLIFINILGENNAVGKKLISMIFQSNYYLWMNRSSTLSQLVSIFLRSVSQRLDAVQEILESNSITLNPVRSLLSHLPDLDRGICSIYHRKVRV